MTLRDRSDGRWSRPGLVTLDIELMTLNDPAAEEQEQIAIISMRGPKDLLQRVVLSEAESGELGEWLSGKL